MEPPPADPGRHVAGTANQAEASAGDGSALVGRERELAAFADALEAMHRGAGRIVLVSGEAGIGKTRLVDAVAERAREGGARVVWGRCWEAGGAPAYWPWIQVLRAILRDPAAGPSLLERTDPRLGAMIPELAQPVAPGSDVDPDSARFLLFDAVAATLREAAQLRPILIVLDDIHAADEPSLLLLRFAASELADAPIVLVAVYRDPELDASDPRQLVIADLARQPLATRVRPGALNDADIAAMVTATTGETATDAVLRTIALETEGNPLFVAEIARLLHEEGRLQTLGHATERLAIPEGVKAVIRRRLDRLSGACRAMLQLASIIGREFDLELLGELGATAAAALEAIDEAVAARVVQESPTGFGRWRFSHALIRDVLYESQSLAVRTGRHDRVGRALERMAADDPEALVSELAYHFVLAAPNGDAERAVRYSQLAGYRATASAAHEEAVRHHRNALATLATDRAAGEAERCRILIDYGEALSRAGLADARETLREAADLAERLSLPDEQARAAIAYGGRFMWARAGTDRKLVPLLTRALAARTGRDDALRVRLLSRLAGAMRDEQDMSRRAAVSAEALGIANRLDDPVSLVHALSARFWAIWGPDALAEMQALASQIDLLADQIGDIERIGDARIWMRISALATLGLAAEETDRTLEDFADAVGRLRQPAQRWYLGVMRTAVALARGQYAGVDELIEQTYEYGRQVQAWDARVSHRLARFTLARERGDLEAVLPAMIAAEGDAPGYSVFRAARIYIEAELGRHDEARASLAPLVARFAELPRDNCWLWTVVHLGEASIRLEDRDAIETFLAALLPFTALAASAGNEVIAGPVARVVGDLAAWLERYDIAERAYADASALVARTGWRPWDGWTRLSRGGMLLRRDRPDDRAQGVDELRMAAQIAEDLGMPVLSRRARLMLGEDPERALHPAPPDSAPVAELAGPASRGADRYVRQGEVWAITFNNQTIQLPDTKGLRYLGMLLSSPGREVPAIDLVTSPGGSGMSRGESRDLDPGHDDRSGEMILDAEARAAYRTRLKDLQEEIDEAEAAGDRGRAALRREEFEIIAHELTAATGLGGRPRGMATAAERARQSVTKAVRATLDRIERAHPDLGAHLRHSIRTGTMCAYEPDPRSDTAWEVDGLV